MPIGSVGSLPTGLWRRLESRGNSAARPEALGERAEKGPPPPPAHLATRQAEGRGQLHPAPAWTGSAGSRISSPGPRAASPRKLCELCGGGSASPAAPGAGGAGTARGPAPLRREESGQVSRERPSTDSHPSSPAALRLAPPLALPLAPKLLLGISGQGNKLQE